MAIYTKRVDSIIQGVRESTNNWSGAGTPYLVKTSGENIYLFNLSGAGHLFYTKSTNNGSTWSSYVSINAVVTTAYAIWYDRWSGIAANLLHIAYTETTNDDVLYLNLDTATDTLSTTYTVFAGSSALAGGTMSITRTRGGNLICCGAIDAGTEIFARKSTDVGVNWSDITAVMESATQDQIILQPDPDSADNQDAFCFFWDASANEISIKRYDNSADTWGETSISGSMTDVVATATYPHWSACPDLTNSQILIAAWTSVDSANADLRIWKVKTGSITETAANAVLNSSDDQGLCSIGIDTLNDYWYVFYAGNSDGSETWNSAVNIYYKISTDGGATWGAETKITNKAFYIIFLYGCPRFTLPFLLMFCEYLLYGTSTNYTLWINSEISSPRATFQLGM